MFIYKRFIFNLVTGIMMIGLITFTTGRPVKSAVVIKQPTTETEPEITATPTPEETVSPTPSVSEEPEPTQEEIIDDNEPNPLLEEIYPDIHDLIQKYYDARAAADIDTLKELVVDPQYISTETIIAQSEYIKGYSDIKCYTKRGGGDIKFVVYCTFNMNISTIDTPIAYLESFYITYQDGQPLIFSGFFDEKTQAVLTKVDSDEDVVALKNKTSEQIAKALDEDPSLYEFWRKLINVVSDEDQQNTDQQESDQPETETGNTN